MQLSDPEDRHAVIKAYLARLGAELADCDAALRHDALIDAEVHLRAAVQAGASPQRAIDDFGSPEEVARAFREVDGTPFGTPRRSPTTTGPVPGTEAAPSTTAQTATSHTAGAASADASGPARPRGFAALPIVGVWARPTAWGALLYFGIVGFALAMAYFVWSITIGSIAFGLLPTLLGLPLFVALLGSARALCLFEGRVVESLLGVRMPRRTQPMEVANDIGFWQRIWCWLRDTRSWLSLAYLIGNFPVSVAAFAATVTLVAFGTSLLITPVVSLLGYPMMTFEIGNAPLSIAAGIAVLTATLWFVTALGWVYGHVVQAIQVARPEPIRRHKTPPFNPTPSLQPNEGTVHAAHH